MTNRVSGFVLQDGQRVFSLDPANIAWRIRDDWLPLTRDGHNIFEHPFLPYIESEAVSRLHKEHKSTAAPPPSPRDDLEGWRLWWVAVAAAYVSESCAGLSPIAAAAARILVGAGELRAALVKQDAPVSALLAMQIICEAIAAGYALTVELEAKEVAEEPRKAAYANGAGKHTDDYTELQRQIIPFAQKRFSQSPTPRIGEVVSEIFKQINRPEITDKIVWWVPPSTRMIRKWLNDATKKGKLHIPEAARKRGRSKSKKD
ncbi:hypothetical protein ACHMW6_15510 [Pseudoduganella sp. UC29_106]|uniref:hypothetical protein n=1 Tax=Pseudoduganella sp. UC29_106 TaxID=3374553 RepID=UPI003757FACA